MCGKQLGRLARHLIQVDPTIARGHRYDVRRVRDYIMTLLVIGNLSRLGAFRNMLVDEFEASCPAQEDMFRTDVQKHKTSKTHGAAGIYLTVSLKRHIER